MMVAKVLEAPNELWCPKTRSVTWGAQNGLGFQFPENTYLLGFLSHFLLTIFLGFIRAFVVLRPFGVLRVLE